MANRFPLIVNPTSKKIEELISGDNLDLTGNGIVANASSGTGISGQYLKSTGTGLIWDNPGDVYLTASQTISNKTITASIISGTTNTFTNIPNSALVNSSITINGTAIELGGTVTTPDNNTTYSISAQDGAAGKKIIRLTSGGNSGAGVDDDVTLVAGTNVTLTRTGDEITINSSYVDTNTVTRLAASGGVLVSGDVTIAASGAASVSQVGQTITVSATDTNTVTRLRGTAAGTYTSGDLTLLASGATTVSQSGTDITVSSTDTVTRVRATGGTLTSGDITIAASGSSTVSQAGSTITINSTYVDTVTRLRGTTSGTYVSGDVTINGTGSATVSQVGNTITVNATDTNTTYSAGDAITLSGTTFSLKNNANFTNSRLLKWDSGNTQLTNSIISDDGSTVTINGNLTVTGATSTIESQTLVVADAQIELRKGNNLTGADGGIQVNRTTDGLGLVQTYSALQWYETGAYWRVYNGSVGNRLVTEDETQTLTNKTLTSPILTTPSLGSATATTINGLAISSVVSGTLTIANNKTLTANNTLTFSGTDGSSVAFGTGGTVAYRSNNLSVFAATTSAQLRGVISDETGSGVAVFNTSPTFTTSVVTNSTTLAVFNTTATTINAFGAATAINFGASTGTTTIAHNLTASKTVTLGSVVGDVLTVNGTATFANADINIRSASPIAIGRGGGSIASNTRVGFNALNSNSTGSQNTAFGYEAALTVNTGAGVVAIGYQALRSASTGQYNVAIGRSAGTGILGASNNVAIGANALETNTIGNNNVCIGYYAGAGATGSGNVLIGPAPNANNTNVTHTPPSPSGDNQLVIGSGTSSWIRGDNNFDVTFPQNANVGGSLTVSGNLTVNGTTVTLNTQTIAVDDKEISLADVTSQTFTATIVSGSANITAITPTTGLIPGQVVSISTAGLSVPAGTTIVSITNNTAVLSNPVTGSSGTATFNAQGATDATADGAGIRVIGTTDKRLYYDNTASVLSWTSTENFNLATGKQYRIGNVLIASGSQIGPSSGSFSLGAGVTSSSLTTVGTLTGLTVSGATNLKQITETVANAFNTTLAPSSGTLTVDTSLGTVILGALNASVTTWAFTNVTTTNSKATTVTVILQGNTSFTYGDACSINGTAVTNGVKWSGGSSPSSSANYDIITFTIVRDSAGTINVFGSSTVNFS